MFDPTHPRTSGSGILTRRGFIAGALATGVLASCSSDGDGGSGSGATSGSATSGAAAAGSTASEAAGPPAEFGTYTVVQRFPQNVQVPGAVRLPFSLSTGAADLVQDGPSTLGAQVLDLDGNPIGDRIEATRRDVDPAPYYDFRFTVDAPGVYALLIDGGPPTGANFQIAEPGSVPVPGPGQLLPGFATPTVGDAAGVDPICTREPEICPFHTLTLAEALNVGRPVAYYVGTPAFCSTGSCGPALESLIEVREQFGDTFVFVHAEIYTDTTATTVAPAVQAVGMFYEPALFVTDASGTIVDRLDAVWNTAELTEVLAAVS